MKKSIKDVEDEIFNKFLIPGNQDNDSIRQIATSICLDRDVLVEFVKELGVVIFDYFYQITNSCDNSLLIVLTKDKKIEFQKRLNDINQPQLNHK